MSYIYVMALVWESV